MLSFLVSSRPLCHGKNYLFALRVHSDCDFVAFMEWEEAIPRDLCGYVNEELVVFTFAGLRGSVHESAFSLEQVWCPLLVPQEREDAKRFSGTQFATPIW